MTRAIRSRPVKVILEGSVDLSPRQAVERGLRPANARREEPPRGGARARRTTEESEPRGEAPKRGVSRPERRRKALGPAGRQHARVDAIPHGKKGTHAGKRGPRRNASQPTRSKPVRGSPKAKRRIENRRRAHR